MTCSKSGRLRGRALGRTTGRGHPRIDDKPIAVLYHQMPHVTELGLLAGTLAEQSRVGISGRGMGLIPAFLAVKVTLRIAPTAAIVAHIRRLATGRREHHSHAFGLRFRGDPVNG
jgi:hypothetical protein